LKAIIPQSQNWDQLISALNDQNIGMAFNYTEEKDKIQGVIFNKNGNFFSGSKEDRQFSYSRIDRELQFNEQLAFPNMKNEKNH